MPVKDIALIKRILKGLGFQNCGRIYKGNCPYHNDTEAMLIAIPATQSFGCCVCGKQGTTSELIARLETIKYEKSNEGNLK